MANQKQAPGSEPAGAEVKAENNAKCSFCGNDAFCDNCSKSPDASAEHMCYDCYQQMSGQMPEGRKIHVCIPPDKMAEMYQRFLDDVTGKAFEELWNSEKKRIRELSKQEIAQACFFEGARFMNSFMQRMQAETGGDEGEETEKGKGEAKK